MNRSVIRYSKLILLIITTGALPLRVERVQTYLINYFHHYPIEPITYIMISIYVSIKLKVTAFSYGSMKLYEVLSNSIALENSNYQVFSLRKSE